MWLALNGSAWHISDSYKFYVVLQPRDKYGNQWVDPYYGGQFYNGYGYMVPQPDPRMYPAAPYYPMYGGHQQQVSWGN